MRGAFTQLGLPLSLVLLCGCFDAPPLEDRWTRLDLREIEWTNDGSGARALRVRGEVTYRAILTGTVALELRRSATLGRDALHLKPEDDRRLQADDVTRLLSESNVVGGDARAVTGWDHLVQGFEFNLAAADTGGFFVVFYLGDGERVEREDAGDTLVVTPWDVESHEVLPTARWVDR